MRRRSSRARATRTSRWTATTRKRNGRDRTSTSATGSRSAGSGRFRSAANRRWLQDGFGATCLGNWDLYAVVALQTGRPFTVAIHPDIDISNTGRASLGFGVERPAEPGRATRRSPIPDPSAGSTRCAFAMPTVRHVRRRRPQHARRPGLQEPEPRAHAQGRAQPRRAAAPARGVQSLQLDELRSARQLPRLADIRPDSLGQGRQGDSSWESNTWY